MTVTMKDLGIDSLSPEQRVALAIEIWESLGDARPVGSLTAEQLAELVRRDAELEANPGMAMTWEQIRARPSSADRPRKAGLHLGAIQTTADFDAPLSEDFLHPKDRVSPVLPVMDVEAASRYFRDKLGFTIRQSVGDGWGWTVVSRGTSEILLVPKDWPAGFSIRVDDVDAVFAELLSLNADFESGPTNQEYGHRDFLVSGPEGYAIGFWAPLKDEERTASPPDETGDDGVPF